MPRVSKMSSEVIVISSESDDDNVHVDMPYSFKKVGKKHIHPKLLCYVAFIQ